jgi:hypothetical protein
MNRDDRRNDGTEDFDERCDGTESCDCDECMGDDAGYCELCGVYLDGDINPRHREHGSMCIDCGQDQAFLDGDDNAYDEATQ